MTHLPYVIGAYAVFVLVLSADTQAHPPIFDMSGGSMGNDVAREFWLTEPLDVPQIREIRMNGQVVYEKLEMTTENAEM